MKYAIRVTKKFRNIKVYAIRKKAGKSENFVTKLFLKVFRSNKSGGSRAT